MSDDTAIDKALLRNTLGHYPTGVTIVTTLDDSNTPQGFTANSFTSVSLTPPLVLICLAHDAPIFPIFATTERFAVNILAADQTAISNRFAIEPESQRFTGVDWQPAPDGNPLIDRASAWLECRLSQRIEAGDHQILIGEVTAFGDRNRAALGYYQGQYLTALSPAAGD